MNFTAKHNLDILNRNSRQLICVVFLSFLLFLFNVTIYLMLNLSYERNIEAKYPKERAITFIKC